MPKTSSLDSAKQKTLVAFNLPFYELWYNTNTLFNLQENLQQITPNQASTKLINASNDVDAIGLWLSLFLNSKHTFANYRKEAERFLLWLQLEQHKQLAQTSLEDILNYQKFCQNPLPHWLSFKRYGRAHPLWRPFSGALSSNSLRLSQTILSSLFSWLNQAGYLNLNPFILLKRKQLSPNIQTQTERFISKPLWQAIIQVITQQVQTVLASVKQFNELTLEQKKYLRHYWLLHLFYLTGMRISESLHNPLNNLYAQAYTNMGAEPNLALWLKIMGKGQKLRHIPIQPSFLQAMYLYWHGVLQVPLPQRFNMQDNSVLYFLEQLEGASQTTNVQALAYLNQDLYAHLQNALLSDFNQSQQTIYTPTRATAHNWVKDLFKTAYDLIIVQKPELIGADILLKASAHWIRHTAWTHMADAKIDVRFIRDNAGHASIATTNLYLHSDKQARHSASMAHTIQMDET